MDFLLEITSNQIFLYFLHFFGSFFDSLIFTSFFVAWEVFFLSWGYLSSEYLNFFICYFLLVFWALIWDNLSYFLWKKYSKKIFSKNWKIFSEKRLEKWEKLLKKHWLKIIFFSRFVWPFYWIIPTVSWVFGVDYKKFFLFNFAWICFWVLHFMAYWYFFAIWFEYFWTTIFVNLLLFIIFVYFSFLFHLNTKKYFKNKNILKIFLHFLKYFFYFFASFIFVLIYYYFFLYPKDAVFYDEKRIIYDFEKYIYEMDKKIYSDKIIKTNSNPINLVIITENNLDEIMEKIAWKKNLSFSSGEITISKFFELFNKKEPPISDYYHNWYNQNFQYQDFSKSSAKRNHIRFWLIWQTISWEKIYISSVSEDKNYSLMINNWLPIIWHSIEKDIDRTRDYFLSVLSKNIEKMEVDEFFFKQIKQKNYFTDGKIIVIKI